LVAVDPGRKVASFARADGERVERPYELLHVVPPQSAPEFIKASPLAGAAGWVDVDRHTLQHTRFANIFALGDVTGTPNAKTAAAVRQQAPVVVANLLGAMAGKALRARYDGYGACPLTTARGRVMLAEFAYDGVVTPSFPGDLTRERRSYWYLKKLVFPSLYWDVMLQGYVVRWPRHRPLGTAAAARPAAGAR
ncbi:MAG TPA: FAD/NAD(P)-binding oxidoreductase, partial [Gammaproteobacteria bacterium]|nr:FAD/NAD(P)-binding oxidoreductase [Gammaproteobacteria bacterium]